MKDRTITTTTTHTVTRCTAEDGTPYVRVTLSDGQHTTEIVAQDYDWRVDNLFWTEGQGQRLNWAEGVEQ